MALRPLTGRQLSSIFDDGFGSLAPFLRAASDATFAEGGLRPALDVREHEGGYQVTAELPGIKKEDVKLSFSDNGRVLNFTGEYSHEHKDENQKDGKGSTYWLTEVRRCTRQVNLTPPDLSWQIRSLDQVPSLSRRESRQGQAQRRSSHGRHPCSQGGRQVQGHRHRVGSHALVSPVVVYLLDAITTQL